MYRLMYEIIFSDPKIPDLYKNFPTSTSNRRRNKPVQPIGTHALL